MRALPPLLAVALAACGAPDREPAEATSGAHRASADGDRVTTRLEADAPGCVTSGVGVIRCPGPGGYALLLADHDGRAALTVVDPTGREHPLDAAAAVDHAGESRFRDTAEWHTRPHRRTAVPTALIVTHVAVRPDGPRNSAGERLDLLVVKIAEETCITDRIPAAPDARAEARRLAATAADRPCLRAE